MEGGLDVEGAHGVVHHVLPHHVGEVSDRMERGLDALEIVLANRSEKLHRLVHVGGHLVELLLGEGDSRIVGDAGNGFPAQGHESSSAPGCVQWMPF